jgi:hypothetical protein
MNQELRDKYQAVKAEFDAKVLKMLLEEPQKGYRQVAAEMGCTLDWVLRVAHQGFIIRTAGRKPGISPAKSRKVV